MQETKRGSQDIFKGRQLVCSGEIVCGNSHETHSHYFGFNVLTFFPHTVLIRRVERLWMDKINLWTTNVYISWTMHSKYESLPLVTNLMWFHDVWIQYTCIIVLHLLDRPRISSVEVFFIFFIFLDGIMQFWRDGFNWKFSDRSVITDEGELFSLQSS